MRKSNVLERFATATMKGLTIVSDNHRRVLQKIREYLENQDEISKIGRSLLFYGKVGTGKTMLANIIVKNWKGSAYYVTAREYTREVRATYNSHSITEQDVLNKYASYDMLAIDEVGKQFATDTERFMFFDLINLRYNKLKPTVMITNMNMADLKEFVGEDTIDRLRDNGGMALLFDWDSMRGRV